MKSGDRAEASPYVAFFHTAFNAIPKAHSVNSAVSAFPPPGWECESEPQWPCCHARLFILDSVYLGAGN